MDFSRLVGMGNVMSMFIPEIEMELAVASCEGAETLVHQEPGRWHVISIHGKFERRAHLPAAKEVVEMIFDDIVVENTEQGLIFPHPEHAKRILLAFERIETKPMLVHCAYGASRSPAVALGALYQRAKQKGVPDPVGSSLGWLRRIMGTKEFSPNPRVGRLLIEAIDSEESHPFKVFRNHPLWPKRPENDFYSRFLPKPKKDPHVDG